MVQKRRTSRAQSMSTKKTRPTFLDKVGTPENSLKYKCLIFGPSRSGKTTFAATAGYDTEDRAAPVLLLDFEGGAGSAAGIPNVKVATMRDWDDFTEAAEFLMTHPGVFNTVVVDSLSELHIFSLLNVIDHELATNPKRAERGNPNVAEQSDFGRALVQMRRFLRTVRDFPAHVLVTALSKTEDYAREGSVRVPAMFGQLAGESVGFFPIVGYLINERSRKGRDVVFKRRLFLQNTEGVRVGVRVPLRSKFPDSIEEPTVPKLFDALDSVYKGDTK